jgi:DNA polymerase III delta prime subunit
MTSTIIPELEETHKNIHNKLNVFIKNRKIPNIIFYGPHGSGKTYILNRFIHAIYDGDKNAMKNYIMRANCAHGKGIRFIREELKFFAKTNIDMKEGAIFKTVILTNADKLTIDAQSALRRCIELFSSSTRFFIVVENKDSLLKPILSRFCDIYIPPPMIAAEAENGCDTHRPAAINIHSWLADKACDTYKIHKSREHSLHELIKIHPSYLQSSASAAAAAAASAAISAAAISAAAECADKPSCKSYEEILNLSGSLYEQGYCGLDIIDYIHTHPDIIDIRRYELLIMFDKVRKEFRNEKLLMLYFLHFIVFRCNVSLENISFM